MILSGIIAASGAGFVATGGNQTFDANGYRHHLFTSSGNLNISGEKTVYVLSQNGGGNAPSGFASASSTEVSGGPGGFGGSVLYQQGTASSNITVAVAGAASSNVISGITLSQWQPTYNGANRGGRAILQGRWTSGCCWPYYYEIFANSTNGESGPFHSSVSEIYSGINQFYSRAGGGGGGGGALGGDDWGDYYSYNITAAYGGSGGNAGGFENFGYGSWAFGVQSAATGAPNSGQGGGGAGAQAYTPHTYPNFSTNPPAQGGSGYVVISYAL